MSVSTFAYTAMDTAGKQLRGTLRASDEHEAYGKLSLQGLTPTDVKLVSSGDSRRFGSKVKTQDIVNLTRELAVLVEAKIPLDRGLASIAEQESNPQLAAMLRDIGGMIEAGQPMTEALTKYKKNFGEVYIETIRAAEKSGNLQSVMTLLAEMLEKQVETRQQMIRALSYPVIVICMVFAALSVIVGFVVPKFAKTFQTQGVKLPLATRIVQAVGDSVQGYWWAYLAAIIGTIVTIIMMWKNEKGRVTLELALLRIPYVGEIITSVCVGRFSRVLAISLGSGLDIIESLSVAARSTGRPVFVTEADEMCEKLRSGDRLADLVKRSRYLPPFAQRMLGAGKDSSEVSRTCDIVARHYERQSAHLTKNVNTIVEPIITVGLAAIVLTVALSVFLPMWQMARVSKK
jgi:type II secretory pathway component PulF